MMARSTVVIGILFWLPSSALPQQSIREQYLDHLPPQPRIVAQTAASARLHLYGDPAAPGYRDASPRDGVDDARAERLLALAERFSPILRRNTNNVPREVSAYFGERLVLHADTWHDGRRVASRQLDLGPPRGVEPAASPGASYAGSPAASAPDDVRLDSLIRALLPRPRAPVVPPDGEPETVLYVDLAGEDEVGWRRELGRIPPHGSRVYVHPLLHQPPTGGGPPLYEVLLQYWFFYPYNDGANNHEGDWEHITVSVTTHQRAREHPEDRRARGLLTEDDVRAILGDPDPLPPDSLRIRNVAYYFHNNVMVLDYLAIARGEPVAAQTRSSDGALHVWEDTTYVQAAVRRRLELADGRLATHPVGYIGGNNKGMDELLQFRPRFLASYNRDSHGTYPFPGVWRRIGPLDATEKIWGDVVPRLHMDAAGRPDPAREWHQLIDDPRYLVYRRSDLVLLPDWERLLPLMDEPQARREWFWMVLPVHLGFPATPSPGAGTLRRVDLGNVAPLGPAYNSSWNRPGATAVYREYAPTVLRVALAPISPLSSLQSGWGVLNYPLVLWGLMPGGNVAVTQLLPWLTGAMHLLGAPPAKTFYLGQLPERFTSVGIGTFRQFSGHDFARLLPGSGNAEVGSLMRQNAATGARHGRPSSTGGAGTRLWLNLYYGPRVSVENTFSLGTADLAYAVEDSTGGELGEVTGTLNTRELAGGLTFRLPPTRSDVLRLYLRTGYAYTAYSLHGVALDGAPLESASLRGGYMLSLLPSRRWWPNSFYGGAGLELFSPPHRWLLRRLGYGLRLEATGLLHRMAASGECVDCHVTAERGDVSLLLLFSW